VLFDHRLDAILWIAARADQILLRVIDLILIQFFLCVRNVELIFERIFLVTRRLFYRRFELFDLRLRSGQAVFGLLQPRLNLPSFRS
jgi:hypothetical protein